MRVTKKQVIDYLHSLSPSMTIGYRATPTQCPFVHILHELSGYHTNVIGVYGKGREQYTVGYELIYKHYTDYNYAYLPVWMCKAIQKIDSEFGSSWNVSVQEVLNVI